MQKRRIPATLEPFNWYLQTVNEYLHKIAPGETLTRGEILGMNPGELTTLNHFTLVWTSGDPDHPGVWDLHSRKNRKTATTRADVVQIMNDFSAFFRPILVRISGSPNITNDDRAILNIAHPVLKRSRPTQSIKEKCTLSIMILGHGRIQIKCYSSGGGRARKPENADAAEIAYALVLPHQFSTSGEEIPLRAIMGPDDKTTKIISTKASFHYELGEKYQGYQMQYFARWINTKHPNINGPWTGMEAVFIG